MHSNIPPDRHGAEAGALERHNLPGNARGHSKQNGTKDKRDKGQQHAGRKMLRTEEAHKREPVRKDARTAYKRQYGIQTARPDGAVSVGPNAVRDYGQCLKSAKKSLPLSSTMMNAGKFST